MKTARHMQYHLEISLIELEIFINELDISLIQLEISLNELEISLITD